MTQAYLYKWTYIPTQQWYIGSRTRKDCHPNDGYICSSAKVEPMIVASRKDWIREILIIGEPLYIRTLEGVYLTLLSAAQDPMSFNEHNATGEFHRTGKSHSEKTKKKLRDAFLGTTHTEETRKKMSESRTGNNNHFYGKHHSEDTKQALSAINLNKVMSADTKLKISNTLTGTVRPDSVKKQISESVKQLPKLLCVHCNNNFLPAHFGRFHGNNCKSLKEHINE